LIAHPAAPGAFNQDQAKDAIHLTSVFRPSSFRCRSDRSFHFDAGFADDATPHLRFIVNSFAKSRRSIRYDVDSHGRTLLARAQTETVVRKKMQSRAANLST
jgi:hypothetical protein